MEKLRKPQRFIIDEFWDTVVDHRIGFQLANFKTKLEPNAWFFDFFYNITERFKFLVSIKQTSIKSKKLW